MNHSLATVHARAQRASNPGPSDEKPTVNSMLAVLFSNPLTRSWPARGDPETSESYD